MGNKLTLPSIRNVQPTFFHIWFDVKPNEIKENGDEKYFFSSTNNDNLESMDDGAEFKCETYIRSVGLDKMLVLTVSETTASDLIRRAHNYSQIKAILIVSSIESKNALLEKWSNYIKVRIVSINELVSRINSFESRWLCNKSEQFSFDLFNPTKAIGCTSTDLNGEFLTSQHLIHVLISLKPSVKDKDEFIDQCAKASRKENPSLLKNIEDFRNNYTPSDALTYYTKPTFYFKELNMALRTRDVELLFLFRFFIRDLFDQLSERQCQNLVHVCRGQLMQNEEIQRLAQSVGQLISVNSFLSTSLDEKVARQYLDDRKILPGKINEKETYEESVLFKIQADPIHRDKPFAIIGEKSAIFDEKEVLFGAGSIFHLKSVSREEQDNGYHPIWIFEMELRNVEEHELKYLFYRLCYNYTNEEIRVLSFSSFGLLLCNMEKYKFASQLFRRILRDVSSTNLVEQARCQKIMANLASGQHHYWQSLRWYNRSLKTYETIDSNDSFAGVASVYNGMGHVYFVRKQYKQAHISYQKSLTMWQIYYDEDQDQEEIAFCYINEARVYLAENCLEKASELSRQGLCILYKYYLDTPLHPNLVSTHHILGNVLRALGMLDLAIDHYIETLIITSKTFSQDRSFLSSVYSDLQVACEKAERNFEQVLADNRIPIVKDQIYIDYFNKNHGTRYQMMFKCPRCKQWQWIFTVFRPIKRFVCTGCWRRRCPRLMSYFWVIT